MLVAGDTVTWPLNESDTNLAIVSSGNGSKTCDMAKAPDPSKALSFPRRLVDGEADPGEVEFARKVLVPTVAAVSLTAFGFAAAKACCGVKYRKMDPYGILPIGMAVATSAVAMWSYLNPQPMHLGNKKR